MLWDASELTMKKTLLHDSGTEEKSFKNLVKNLFLTRILKLLLHQYNVFQ